jgi:biopolymer transport protein ExbD
MGGADGSAGGGGGARANGGFALEGRRRRSVLSMAPLIDFTFILLIFFMVVTQFDRFTPVDMTVNRATQAPVALPPPAETERRRLHLRVRADGIMVLDGEAIGDVETFTGVLAHHQAPAGAPPEARPLLLVEMEDEVSVQLIIDTMQALQKLPGLAVRIVFHSRQGGQAENRPASGRDGLMEAGAGSNPGGQP